MKYVITRKLLGFNRSIEISRDEFVVVHKSKERLLIALGIEEKFDIVVENYKEYEQELLVLALNYMMALGVADWSSFISDLHSVNRRVANLLATGRLYVDALQHDLRAAYGKDHSAVTKLRERIKEVSDTNSSFRIMPELRNYAQHRGLVIHRLSYPSDRIDETRASRFRFRARAEIELTRLNEDPRARAHIVPYIAWNGTHADASPLIRGYVAGMSQVHQCLRSYTANDVVKWETTLTDVIERARNDFGDDLIGLAVAALDDRDHATQWVEIFEDFLERRKKLARKNREMTDLARWFVSNESD